MAQIVDLHHWERWWATRPELNILDLDSLYSDIAWYSELLTPRELSLIPDRGISADTNERDYTTLVVSTSASRGHISDTRPSLKRRSPPTHESITDDDDEFPLHRIKRRRMHDNSTNTLILGDSSGDKLGTAGS